MTKFLENKDGVHLTSPFADHTLCGDTNDGDTNPFIDVESLKDTNKRIVTCVRCIRIIVQCRGVRFDIEPLKISI